MFIDDGIQELQEPGDLLKRSKKSRQPTCCLTTTSNKVQDWSTWAWSIQVLKYFAPCHHDTLRECLIGQFYFSAEGCYAAPKTNAEPHLHSRTIFGCSLLQVSVSNLKFWG